MSQPSGIPRRLGHVWVGPKQAPTALMETWPALNPTWDYTLYDDTFMRDFPFRTRAQIDEYWKRGQYEGVADLMRYEILFAFGGFLGDADSRCLRSLDGLFDRPAAYTAFENELVRGKLVSPIFACEPGNAFVGDVIDRLSDVPPADLDSPWKTTGNLFMTLMIEELKPDVVVFPSHFFIPKHYTGVSYSGSDQPYAEQSFMSEGRGYKLSGFLNRLSERAKKRYRRRAHRHLTARLRNG